MPVPFTMPSSISIVLTYVEDFFIRINSPRGLSASVPVVGFKKQVSANKTGQLVHLLPILQLLRVLSAPMRR